MATKTYVDGGKQAIPFNNDTQPVAVYVDGDLQQNVSFVPDTVQGTGSVEYTSEYKKNHIEYEVSGNTFQQTYQGLNLIDTQGTVEKKIGTWSFAKNKITSRYMPGNYNHFYFAKEYEAGTYTLSFDKTDVLSVLMLSTASFGGGTYNEYYGGYYVTMPAPCKRTLTFNASFKLGFMFDAPNSEDVGSIWNVMFSKEDVPYEPYVGGEYSPNPEFPQPIENANVSGENIFTTENASVSYNLSYQDGSLSASSTGNVTDFIEVEPNTTYEFSLTVTDYTAWTERKVIGYDENKNFYCVLSGMLFTKNETQTTYFNTFEGVKYLRMTYKPADTNISVKSVMQISVHGKNLFNTQGHIRYKSASVKLYDDYIYNKNTNGYAGDYMMFSKLYPAGTYRIKFNIDHSGTTKSIRLLLSAPIQYASWYNQWNSYSRNLDQLMPNVNFRFTVDKPFQLGFCFGGSSGAEIYLTDIMLTKDENIPYEPFWEETVDIPTSVTYTQNGSNRTAYLRFSEYDKLTVDRTKGEVTFYQGGYYASLVGNEGMGSSSISQKVWLTIPYKLTGNGYCNQFVNRTDFTFVNNVGFSESDSGMAFPMSRFSSTSALSTFLTEQRTNGNPVVILAEMEEPIPRNITETDLGQSLLNLDTQNQTNYFEITSNGNAPQTPINFTFAKWGGRNENNNNT